MAIDTNTEKLAVMEWGNVWEPGLPLSPGAFGQDDKQQLLWGYPGILWSAASTVATPDVPASRVCYAAAEVRTMTVPTEVRSMTVPAESRTVTVDLEEA